MPSIHRNVSTWTPAHLLDEGGHVDGGADLPRGLNYPSVAVEDPKPPPPATPSSRFASAALPAFLALFLGALTVGVLGSSVSGPPIFGILLRGFFGLVVGGIAVWMAVVAINALRGEKRPAAGAQLPAAIAALCPGVRPGGAQAQWCPFCELPLGARSDAWRAEEQSWGMTLVGLALGAGLLCLGVFVTVGPLLEGERRVWAGIAFAALGLLITAVGALIDPGRRAGRPGRFAASCAGRTSRAWPSRARPITCRAASSWRAGG